MPTPHQKRIHLFRYLFISIALRASPSAPATAVASLQYQIIIVTSISVRMRVLAHTRAMLPLMWWVCCWHVASNVYRYVALRVFFIVLLVLTSTYTLTTSRSSFADDKWSVLDGQSTEHDGKWLGDWTNGGRTVGGGYCADLRMAGRWWEWRYKIGRTNGRRVGC